MAALVAEKIAENAKEEMKEVEQKALEATAAAKKARKEAEEKALAVAVAKKEREEAEQKALAAAAEKLTMPQTIPTLSDGENIPFKYETFREDDIRFLQDLIDNNIDTLIVEMDKNGDGILGPLELGIQNWKNGRLTSFDLANVGLTGNIPESIGGLSQLKRLALYSNQLTGEIPESIGNLVHLEKLYLNDNQLTGRIPESIGNLSSLKRLYLNSNQLSEDIPESIGELASLERLIIFDNKLVGPIPKSIGNLIDLEKLLLYSNQLTDSIPADIGNLFNLEYVQLNNNNFLGTIPDAICDLTIDWSSPARFNISNNQLCPSYPTCIETVVGFQDTTNCTRCDSGFVYVNSDCHWGQDIEFLQELIDNAQTGLKPPPKYLSPVKLGEQTWKDGRLTSLCSSSSISPKDGCVVDYELSGHIPESIGEVSELTSLILPLNDLNGRIPRAIGNLKKLKVLSLEWNELSGKIPKRIGDLVRLEKLELQSNQFTGIIPESIGNLVDLTLLNLRDNQLMGEIPETICNLEKLAFTLEAVAEDAVPAAAEEVAKEAKRAKVEAEKASSVAPGPHQEKITALESNTSRLSNAEIDELVEDGLLTKKQGKAAKRFRNSRGTKVAEVIKQNQATQQAAEPGIFLRTLRSVISVPRKVVSALATRMGVAKTPATAEEVAEEAKRAKVEAEEELAAAKALLDKLRDKAKVKVEAEKAREVTDETKRAKAEPKKARAVAAGSPQEKITALESNTSRLSNAEIDKLVEDGLLTKKQGKAAKRFFNSRGTEVAEVIRENQKLIENLMNDLSKIVSQRRPAKVKLKDGSTIKVDATTAMMLLYVHGALNQNNRVKMAQILAQDKAGFTKMVNFSTKQGKMSSDDHKLSSISNNKLCPPYPECIEDFIGEQDTSKCE